MDWTKDVGMNNAETDAAKTLVMEYILDVWKRAPELRLGQLLEAACTGIIFYRADFRLIGDLEELISHHHPAVEDKLEQ
jgi:hypothetical protein